MCGIQLKYRKRKRTKKDLMFGLNETIDQLGMVNYASARRCDQEGGMS